MYCSTSCPDRFSPGKESRYPLPTEQRPRGSQNRSGRFWGGKIAYPAAVRNPNRPARTLSATPTTLSRVIPLKVYLWILYLVAERLNIHCPFCYAKILKSIQLNSALPMWTEFVGQIPLTPMTASRRLHAQGLPSLGPSSLFRFTFYNFHKSQHRHSNKRHERSDADSERDSKPGLSHK